jgi:hypothetical protein
LNCWNGHLFKIAGTIGTALGRARGIGRKPDSEINHEILGADICNGLKREKFRMSRFFPLFVIQRFKPSVAVNRFEPLELLEHLERASVLNR